MITILGGSGYVGSAFRTLLDSKGIAYHPLSRSDIDYYDVPTLTRHLRDSSTSFLINAAGYTGKPNVDACELHKTECLLGNAILPGIIRSACEAAGIPWGHVSSGCIYSGRRPDGGGFLESDPPNFSFRTNNCSFYSATKALGEEILKDAENCYVWRLRIPFDHRDSPRNYLTKLMNYEQLLDAENSISHLGDFVDSAFACFEGNHPFGIYNLTNPGAITTREVVELIKTHIKPDKEFKFFENEAQFMNLAAKTPRSNCVMNTQKLETAGLPMRPVFEALEEALSTWKS